MFTTGEFPKIARVTRRLLRHYREIGLFEPATYDEMNGYHFYAMSQLPDLNRILALRELGFTLEQIRELISADTSHEAMEEMLRVRRTELERKVEDAVRQLRTIDSRLASLESGAFDVDVIVKPVPSQPYLSATFLCSGPEYGFDVAREVRRGLESSDPEGRLGPMVTILHADKLDFVDTNVEIGYLLNRRGPVPPLEIGSLGFETRTLPGIPTAATVTVHEHPDVWHVATSAIGRWMEAQDQRMAGPQREVWHTFDDPDGEPPLVELQTPVTPAA